MKEILKALNKAFENKVRLGIMSALVVNDSMDFNGLKNLLDVTDGNLATHLKMLEREHFIEVDKVFMNRKPKTTYRVTTIGKDAFVKHINAIEKLIQ